MAFVTTVTMNIGFSQAIIKVWGGEDSLAILAQIEQCLYHLEVYESMQLDVVISENMPEYFEGITLAYEVPNSDQQYFKVRINAQLNAPTQRLVLAHEMVHVKQYVKQELEIIDQQYALWKGKSYNFERVHYRQTPWERDALRNDNQLARLLKDPTSIPLIASKSQQ